jgi:hypothetical protein
MIPVLFDAARVPGVAQMPSELAGLATAQGYDINGNYFDRDADDLARRLEQLLVSRERSSASREPTPPANALLHQLRTIWMALLVVTLVLAIAPFFLPALPQFFWLFPGTMTLAAFLWYLYWMGELQRPPRSRLA